MTTPYHRMCAHVRTISELISTVLAERTERFAFSKGSSDGRLNSISDEDVVRSFLLGHPKLEGHLEKKDSKATDDSEEDNRAFGDILFNMSPIGMPSMPANIKVVADSNKSGNNLCGPTKLIGHTFGGICNNHSKIAKRLRDFNEKRIMVEMPSLYGLIVISKETNRYWVGSLDEVPSGDVLTNPTNNLQLAFPTGRVARTAEEYCQFLYDKMFDVYRKKADPYAILMEGVMAAKDARIAELEALLAKA